MTSYLRLVVTMASFSLGFRDTTKQIFRT